MEVVFVRSFLCIFAKDCLTPRLDCSLWPMSHFKIRCDGQRNYDWDAKASPEYMITACFNGVVVDFKTSCFGIMVLVPAMPSLHRRFFWLHPWRRCSSVDAFFFLNGKSKCFFIVLCCYLTNDIIIWHMVLKVCFIYFIKSIVIWDTFCYSS